MVAFFNLTTRCQQWLHTLTLSSMMVNVCQIFTVTYIYMSMLIKYLIL